MSATDDTADKPTPATTHNLTTVEGWMAAVHDAPAGEESVRTLLDAGCRKIALSHATGDRAHATGILESWRDHAEEWVAAVFHSPTKTERQPAEDVEHRKPAADTARTKR